jgi:hypothetical protein
MNLPPVIEASSWLGAWSALRARVLSLSCADAGRIVVAWTFAVGERAWPLWYQFAAVAYGWSPARDELDTSAAQAARPYPLAEDLWSSMQALAAELDAGGELGYPVFLQFDTTPGEWGDPTWLELVRGALVEDGARPLLVDEPTVEHGSSSGRTVRDSDSDAMWLLALVVGAVWLMETPRRSRLRS